MGVGTRPSFTPARLPMPMTKSSAMIAKALYRKNQYDEPVQCGCTSASPGTCASPETEKPMMSCVREESHVPGANPRRRAVALPIADTN